jgi:hypothetical protein
MMLGIHLVLVTLHKLFTVNIEHTKRIVDIKLSTLSMIVIVTNSICLDEY